MSDWEAVCPQGNPHTGPNLPIPPAHMIRERIKSGLERAKAQGKRLGRKPIDARKEAAILADLRSGKAGIMKLAAAHGVGVGTVQRIKTALALNAV